MALAVVAAHEALFEHLNRIGHLLQRTDAAGFDSEDALLDAAAQAIELCGEVLIHLGVLERGEPAIIVGDEAGNVGAERFKHFGLARLHRREPEIEFCDFFWDRAAGDGVPRVLGL